MDQAPHRDVLRSALRAFVATMRPVAELLGDDAVRADVLRELGANPDSAQPIVITEQLDRIDQYAAGADPDFEALGAALTDVLAVVDAFRAFADSDYPPNDWARLVIAMASTSFLKHRAPLLWSIFRMLGFLEERVFGLASPPTWHENRISEFFSDMGLYFSDRWSESNNDDDALLWADGLFFPLATGLMLYEGLSLHEHAGIHFAALYGWDTPPPGKEDRPDTVDKEAWERTNKLNDRALTLQLRHGPAETATPKLTANFQVIPVEHGGGAVMVTVVPGGPFGTMTFDVGGYKVEIDPPTGPIAVVLGKNSTVLGDINGKFAITVTPPEGQEPFTIGTKGTRVEFTPGATSLSFGAGKQGGRFALKAAVIVELGDADGFLASVIGAASFRVDVDLALGLDTKGNLYFEGGGGFRVTIPVLKKIGPLTLRQLQIGLGAHTNEGFGLEATTALQLALGPVAAVVEGLGFHLRYADEIAVGFTPPKGIGMLLDAGVVRGGGYLFYDADTEQYAGALELDVSGVLTVKAIGLLTTKMPGGADGYSLLVILSAEGFDLQLGFGFSLTAIGGLFGYQRGVNPQAMRDGVKGGTVGSIMFPKNPVANAPALVTTLGTLFPPVADQYTVGLMVRVNWGGRIVAMSLGVIVEFPEPVRIVLLGKIEVAAPDPAAPLVVFNLDLVGILDFGAKEASMDASLYDSRVLVFSITGDMAMRLSWGDEGRFAISIGGFHPRYNPPAQFPRLERAAISMGLGDNPRLRSESYFALTSNTFQTGARTELYAAAAGFNVTGFIGWDLLVQFDPFRFVADFGAGLALRHGTTTLMSVHVQGTLAGFAPLWVSGSASFTILFFEVSFGFTFTLIDDPTPPKATPVDVLALVAAALAQPHNWQQSLPKHHGSLVSLRPLTEAGPLIVHPLATLAVSQGVAPLDIAISQFGQAEPASTAPISIGAVQVGGATSVTEPVTDLFAPACFFDMSDTEKLTRPSFERLHSGVRFGADTVEHGAALTVDLTYETRIVEPDQPTIFVMGAYQVAVDDLSAFAEIGAVATGPARTTGPLKYASAAGPKVRYREPEFAIASTKDLTQAAEQPAVPSYTLALQALRDQQTGTDGWQVVNLEETVAP
jgi:hypothetical protein